MMGWRPLLGLMVAVALLGAFYFYETHKEERLKDQKQRLTQVFQIARHEIKRISLKRQDNSILLEKTKGPTGPRWRLIRPIETEADALAVDQIIGTLESLRYERLITSGVSDDLRKFGLQRPRLTVELDCGERVYGLVVGNKTPLQDAFYAATLRKDKVFTVSDHNVAALDKTVFDLRDKRLFTITLEKIDRATFWRGAKRWVFVRDRDGNWTLEEPFQISHDRLDQDRIETIVQSFLWAKVASFEESGVSDLGPYGLDNPQAGVLFEGPWGQQGLFLGNTVPQDHNRIYARRAQDGVIVTIGLWLLREIPLHENLFVLP